MKVVPSGLVEVAQAVDHSEGQAPVVAAVNSIVLPTQRPIIKERNTILHISGTGIHIHHVSRRAQDFVLRLVSMYAMSNACICAMIDVVTVAWVETTAEQPALPHVERTVVDDLLKVDLVISVKAAVVLEVAPLSEIVAVVMLAAQDMSKINKPAIVVQDFVPTVALPYVLIAVDSIVRVAVISHVRMIATLMPVKTSRVKRVALSQHVKKTVSMRQPQKVKKAKVKAERRNKSTHGQTKIYSSYSRRIQ